MFSIIGNYFSFIGLNVLTKFGITQTLGDTVFHGFRKDSVLVVNVEREKNVSLEYRTSAKNPVLNICV